MVAATVHDLLPDRLQQLPRPPLGLLPEPRRARVIEVSNAHHEEVGGASDTSRELSRFHRTMTSRLMPAGIYLFISQKK